MARGRPLLGWGVFLVAVGLPAAAVRTGLVDPAAAARLAGFWPLVLVAAGLALALSRTRAAAAAGLAVPLVLGLGLGSLLAGGGPALPGCLPGGTGTAFAPRTGVVPPGGRLALDLACGELVLDVGGDAGWRVAGTAPGGRSPEVATDAAGVRIGRGGAGADGAAGVAWRATVPGGRPLALDVAIAAGAGTLDLAGADLDALGLAVRAGAVTVDARSAALRRLAVDVDLGSATIRLPAGSVAGSLAVDLGAIVVCVPDGAAVRVQGEAGAAATIDVTDLGLAAVDGGWASPGWADATTRIDLSAAAAAGSITLEREDGCG